MTTATTIAQAGNGEGPPSSSAGSLIVTNSNNNNNNQDNDNNDENENTNNQHLLPQHMSFSEEEDEAIRQHHLQQQQQQHILSNIDEQDEGRRYQRGGYIHPHQQQSLHNPHQHPHHHSHLHHHLGQLHPGFDQLDRDYHRPVDLGYIRGPYSPGGGNGSAAAVAAVAAAVGGDWSGGHQLAPGQGWMDEGSRGGLIWTAEQQSQYHRYQVSSMKWESSSVRPPSVGGMSTKSKMCSPGSSGIGGHPSDLIPDETLAQLSVKELNKRVQNLPRDDIVALKQRRRTLKNRGYAMNCRLRRQETREKLEVHVKQLEDVLRKVRCERDYYKNRCDKLQQYLNQTSMQTGPSSNSGPGNGHPSTSGVPVLSNNTSVQGLSHSGSLAVAIVHDIPLHAHLMPPLTHHAGHLSNHTHHQGVQLDLSLNGGSNNNEDYKRFSNTPSNGGAPCDLKLHSLSRL